MVVMIFILPLQICVSGVCGAPGQPVQSHAAVESGSATDGPWPLLQDPSVRANRHRARAATQDSAQVQLLLCLIRTRLSYLQTQRKLTNHQLAMSVVCGFRSLLERPLLHTNEIFPFPH